MVRAKRFLTVILTWLLNFVDGSMELSIETVASNLTEETTAFCCAPGYAYSIETLRCLADEVTLRALHFEVLFRKNHPPLHLYAICESDESDVERLGVDLDDGANGSIHLANIGKNHTKNHCLYRKPNATVYWSLKCQPISEERVGLNIWISVCMGFATTVVVTSVIGYVYMLPELHNYRKRMLQHFLISYSGCSVLLAAVLLNRLSRFGQRIPYFIRNLYGNIDAHLTLNDS